MNNFKFDLQLFGKSKGKTAGKLLLTAGAFFFGAGHLGAHWLGMQAGISSGIMAASLVGSIWSMANSKQNNSPSIQRFDKAQESMSSTDSLPVVYGLRKISGNQTYHETNADQNTLHKHVVLCEGGIEGIQSVCANDLLIPTGSQSSNTVFTIQNIKYEDSKVWKDGKTLHLYCNGTDKSVYLCNKDDSNDADTFYAWQASVDSLISWINRLHLGWQAFPVATTTRYPGDLSIDSSDNCYNNPINVTANTVTGGTTYTFHDCEAPSNYEDVGGYPHMAWLDMTFKISDELSGNPSVDCIVKGKKVYDPRTKETAYSTNPAICLMDFLLSKRYGLGRWLTEDDLDIDSFIEAADYCDEVITVYDADNNPLTSKRYTLNMIIDQRQDALTWLQDILANFCGWLVISKDKVKLLIERETPISHKFNDDNTHDVTIAPLKSSEVPNHYEVSLVDPQNNWKVISVICDDYADQKERGKVVSKEVELNGVTSQSQALRLARYYSDYNLSCPINVTFTTGIEAMALEPGDVVTLSYREALKDMPVRILEIKETEDSEFEITARQYNGDIYGDDLGGGIQTKNYTVAKDPTDEDSIYFNLQNVSNLKAVSQFRKKEDGSTSYNILVSFTLPNNVAITSGNVYYKQNNAPTSETVVFEEGVAGDELGYQSEWKCAGNTSSQLTITNVKIGDVYKIRATSCTKGGKEVSVEDAPEVICRVTPKELVPSQPYNLTYDFSKSFYFEWQDVPDSDVVYYEVRNNTKVGQQNGLLGRTTAPSITLKLTSRTGTIYVYAVNSQKKYSYPAKTDYEYAKPEAPSKITYLETPRGVTIQIPSFPTSCSKAKLWITSASVSDVIETENPVYSYQNTPDIYYVRACYIDLIGEGYVSDELTITINPTFNSEWIEDGSLSIAKMDKTINEAVDRTVSNANAILDTNNKVAQTAKDLLSTNNQVSQSAKDILSINDSITELKQQDGLLQSTITNLDNQTATRFTQTENKITTTVADAKADMASQLEQTANSLQSSITSLDNKTASQIKQTNEAITSSVADAKTEMTSQLEQTANSLKSSITALDSKTASQIEQTNTKIETTVANAKTSLESSIQQNSDSISTIVANLNSTDKAKSYSAISSMVDAINLRVQKNDIINQINLTAQGTTIDGKYLHVTGNTLFDNNVVTSGMIKAGAISTDKISTGSITAEKLASDVLTLTDSRSITGGCTTINSSGMTLNRSDGSKVTFTEKGVLWYTSSGNTFNAITPILLVEGTDGKYCKFAGAWTNKPFVSTVEIGERTKQDLGFSLPSNYSYSELTSASSVTTDGFYLHNSKRVLAGQTLSYIGSKTDSTSQLESNKNGSFEVYRYKVVQSLTVPKDLSNQTVKVLFTLIDTSTEPVSSTDTTADEPGSCCFESSIFYLNGEKKGSYSFISTPSHTDNYTYEFTFDLKKGDILKIESVINYEIGGKPSCDIQIPNYTTESDIVEEKGNVKYLVVDIVNNNNFTLIDK